ncbi:MAG: VWA domain-containing protein [Sedimentitalea sp.]|uniref:VWA domain-containing protein n=1 Tax=Sedimentitalea sp. TaxID=2048915 RepID=UPI003266511A
MIELADPLFLLLLPLPLLAVRFLPSGNTRGAALMVPDRIGRGILSGAGDAGAFVLRKQVVVTLIWILLVLALAGPRQLAPVSALKVSGRDLAIAIDLSGSMVRDDFDLNGEQVTRLQAVQSVGADFVRRRAGDRVALIVFGSEAYYAAPFSFDTEAIARRIEEATIGISGRATNISDALGLALKRLEHSEAASRVVILLSDGISNAGATNPRGVAKLAADLGIRVHTIALGPKDLASSAPGERGVVDAATLQAISDLSGGTSFRVRTTDELQEVTAALDRLEVTDSDGLAAEMFRELWVFPAALGGLLLLGVAWREQG